MRTTHAERTKPAMLTRLDQLLADEHVLTMKTRGFHWNVTGPNFSELHKLFETQYAGLALVLDDVAERSRALGGRALGSNAELPRFARLKERLGTAPSASDMLAELQADHEALVRTLGADIAAADEESDFATADFLTGLQSAHQKTAWMLRASR